MVTDADVARARQSQPVITDSDIEWVRRQYTMPAQPRVQPQVGPSIDALPRPAAAPLDLGAVAQGYADNVPAPFSSGTGGPSLLVFISLTMPASTLTRLVDQSARAQAVLVLRGLADGSLTRTLAQVQRLIGQRRVAVQIDPQAFDRFGIEAVPAFVLRPPGNSTGECLSASCTKLDDHVKANGDVSLDHALRALGRGSPVFTQAARPFVKRLER